MKIAQCKYTKAGTEVILTVYFDLKAFDFITPPMKRQQEDEFIYLVCDSIAAALPSEQLKKNLFIKRIFKSNDNHYLKILCTDGFLIDNELNVPLSQQAYSGERIKITESDQLPGHFKLSNELLNSVNDRLQLFEKEARKQMTDGKTTATKETAKQVQQQIVTREFVADKAFDVLAEITHMKKDMKMLSETTIKTLQDEITKAKSNGTNTETLIQKLNEITPSYEKFSIETEEIAERIAKQSKKLVLFKQYIIQALYESAEEFRDFILKKNHDAAPHIKHIAQTDFNKKFSGIATLSESGELSSLKEAENNLTKLSLEDLQDIISNDNKTNPGLLQKCNTSWTEESPELKIVMKKLSQLNEKLSQIFKDEPQYANQEMTHITRIPVPRSFQFKFTSSALNYKKVVDDFCKSQKEILLRLANQHKKMLQIQTIGAARPASATTVTETIHANEPTEKITDLNKFKETSDSILGMANKNHEITNKCKTASQQLYNFLSVNIDSNLKSLAKNIKTSVEKIQTEANNADIILQQIVDAKSKIDIAINHFLLHPQEKPDFNDFDEKIQSLSDKLNQLFAKNKLLQAEINRLTAYDTIIKRTAEIDFSAAKSNVLKQRNEAKESLLEALQNQNSDPAKTQALRKNMLEQYTKIDVNVSDIDKIMTELTGIKNAIFTDMNDIPELSAENLELKFQTISEKMQALTLAMNTMNENVSGLRKLSTKSSEGKK